MEVIKIGILGVTGVLLALQFRTNRPEYGIYLGTVLCLLIFACSLKGLEVLMDKTRQLEQYLKGSESYLAVLFKAVGITYVCEFCASICKDAGYGAVAGQIEIFGKLLILAVGMPIVVALLETVSSLLG